jgi:hypothetical protein
MKEIPIRIEITDEKVVVKVVGVEKFPPGIYTGRIIDVKDCPTPLRNRIARALYDNHRAAGRSFKAMWEKADQVEKDSWLADADVVMGAIKADKLEEMRRYPKPRTYEVDINGDQ